MASTSPRQRRITGRVMHEFKHGELKRGRGGKAGKVKSRRQAIAIALEEAGKSKYESGRRNRPNLRRTESKEAKGRTAQQEREGKSHIGARSKRESTGYGWARCPQDDGERAKPRGRDPAKAMVTPGKNLCQGAEATRRGTLKDEQASVGKCTWSALSFICAELCFLCPVKRRSELGFMAIPVPLIRDVLSNGFQPLLFKKTKPDSELS